MRSAERLPASSGDDKIELVCPNGHRTIHSLSRVLRLDDGWCGKCGADISYTPDAAPAPADKPVRRRASPIARLAALISAPDGKHAAAPSLDEGEDDIPPAT